MKQLSLFFTAIVAALALAGAAPARASDSQSVAITPFFGAWIPIGSARGDFDNAPMTGLQLSYDMHPNVAVVGTVSWVSTSAKRFSGAELDVLQYDLGMRAQQAFALGRTSVRPFLGVGVGQSRFMFRDDAYSDGPAFAFYSSGGAELGYRSVTAGFTVRHQMNSLDASALDIGTPRHNLGVFTSVGLRF